MADVVDFVAGVVERHYLKCPYCPGRMDLDERRCGVCGARPVAILWTLPEASTPELVLVSRRYYVPSSWRKSGRRPTDVVS